MLPGFIRSAWHPRCDVHLAMPTFRYSIVYLFGLFVVPLADHYATGLAGRNTRGRRSASIPGDVMLQLLDDELLLRDDVLHQVAD